MVHWLEVLLGDTPSSALGINFIKSRFVGILTIVSYIAMSSYVPYYTFCLVQTVDRALLLATPVVACCCSKLDGHSSKPSGVSGAWSPARSQFSFFDQVVKGWLGFRRPPGGWRTFVGAVVTL